LVKGNNRHGVLQNILQCSELRYCLSDNRIGKYVNMADINKNKNSTAVSLVELLFFAYRDFVADPDHILEGFGFGRAHHRVVHFVGRDPGLTVAELLDILKITKQSLARVLKELIDKGYVFQKEGANDRRQRLLYLTQEGEALRARLMGPQVARFERAFAETGLAPEQFHSMLLHLVDPENQRAAEDWAQGLKQRG
jgi:DNA-binding MarR family transcriptional regulator